MKKRYSYLLASAIVLFAACAKDDIPEYDVRDEYVGHYVVNDMCEIGTANYELDILYVDDYYSDEIVFGFPGLFEAGMDVHAIVTGMKIIIPLQDFYISNYPDIFYEFSGSGSLEGNVLTINYRVLTIQNGLIMDDVSCSALLTRQ
ncbi:MAG: hypothetical protein R2794_01415 [Chitinophagales bacterium]